MWRVCAAQLYSKLGNIERGVDWRKRREHEQAMSAGRAVHSTGSTRRRQQRVLAEENKQFMQILKKTQARFATPEEIALLTGKPMPGAGGGGGEEGGGDDE